jgi:hypothetical protein
LLRVEVDIDSHYGLIMFAGHAWAASGNVRAVTHNKRLLICRTFT